MAKQELIKERNELAKQLCIHTDMNSPSCFNEANIMMSLLYGDSWNNENEHDNVTDCQPDTNPIVSIAEQGGQKGVRFCIGDVDMFIEAHDLDEDGKEYMWSNAMNRLKEVGKDTFSHKQGLLMAAYRNEINAALREIGGDELKGYYWTFAEYSTNTAWYVNFSVGSVNGGSKCNRCTVRACAAFKN